MNKFDEYFQSIIEQMTDGGVMGGPTEIGEPALHSADTYAPGDARIPSSLFPKKRMLTRRGMTRSRKRRK